MEPLTYAVVLEPERIGGLPALPEVHTQGATVEHIPSSDSGALLAVVTVAPAR